MATYDLKKLLIYRRRHYHQKDEFNFAGVTKEKCIEAPGYRVKESPVHFECEYVQTIRIQLEIQYLP